MLFKRKEKCFVFAFSNFASHLFVCTCNTCYVLINFTSHVLNVHVCFDKLRLGEDVPFTKKGKFGVVHGSIQEQFNPYHLFIETGSKDDFQTDKILLQVCVHIHLHMTV